MIIRYLLPALVTLVLGACGSSDSESPAAGGSGGSVPTSVGDTPDTRQSFCFDSTTAIDCPTSGALFGQDAQYDGAQPAYTDNGNDTVTDLVTGLMWTQAFSQVQSWDEAIAAAASITTGGHADWRVPTITELYSLMDFGGNTGSGAQDGLTVPDDAVPFLDSDVFDFEYGQTNRFIDAQYISATKYVSTTMFGDETFFGVNFADGRIKGYPTSRPATMGTYYVRFVRGDATYGQTDLIDNGDETITDQASALTWMTHDNGHYGVGDATYGGLLWEDALAYCEDLSLAGHDDWRLPNAKELQSIVDYTRSPTTTDSAAIDPLFDTTPITIEDGSQNYAFYWTSTTHVEGGGQKGAYVAFGQAFGWMDQGGNLTFVDVHGAGCQRSDPKVGDPAEYPNGFGPQGDVIRIYNFVRCVRGGATPTTATSPASGWSGGTGGTDPTGPASCTAEADCQAAGACPPDFALGCTCAPQGICIPACNVDANCPAGMNGETLVCNAGGCAPAL